MVLRIIFRMHFLSSSIGKVKFYRTSAVSLKTVQFNLSDIGEGIREVTVREWSVKLGDVVAQFDKICSVESDKATVSITSRYDGTIKKLYYQIGEVALVGKPLVDIEVKETENVSMRKSASLPTEEPKLINSELTAKPEMENKIAIDKESNVEHVHLDSHYLNKTLATPAVRRIAKENNILLSTVTATGKGGRVLKEDILLHLEGKSSVNIKTDETSVIRGKNSKEIEKVEKIEGIKKVMVKTMMKSHEIPTFGYCDEIDMSKLIKLQKDIKEHAKLKGVNVTFMPFLIKALSKALTAYPILNASVDENCENIIFKSSHNVGIAMDTNEGLIVPNIKNVEKLTISEIAIELTRLLKDGRDLRLTPKDMSGGTITISNIGVIGGTYTRPLILSPEVCIVALGKTRLTPIFSESGEIKKAYLMAASWTADHRILDGATVARFSNVWKDYLENPNYLLMDL